MERTRKILGRRSLAHPLPTFFAPGFVAELAFQVVMVIPCHAVLALPDIDLQATEVLQVVLFEVDRPHFSLKPPKAIRRVPLRPRDIIRVSLAIRCRLQQRAWGLLSFVSSSLPAVHLPRPWYNLFVGQHCGRHSHRRNLLLDLDRIYTVASASAWRKLNVSLEVRR